MRVFFLSCALLWVFFGVRAQNGIIFSKTQHDFGEIAPSSIAYEQDFLFRNTATSPASVLGVISSSPSLKAIHTRSQVQPGEYGFVKIKLLTDSLEALFNEYVEVSIDLGGAVVTQRVYIRAEVYEDGLQGSQRSFTDSEVALTVEVSPDDVEDMEGFLGEDKLARAETEIAYLRRQLKLQSDLLFRFSEDLKEKQLAEQENLQRLSRLEEGIRQNSKDETILRQIGELSERLLAIQESDRKLRSEFSRQEAEYKRLKHEADSARAYAEQLSRDLRRQFEAEAAAIERANRLEEKLASKQALEQRQRALIDSLQAAIDREGSLDHRAELEQLKLDLANKSREQELQQAQALKQQQRIEQLRREKEGFRSRSDSLAQTVVDGSRANEALQQQLAQTAQRISDYQQVIDSLETMASQATQSESELEKLRMQLSALEERDTLLQHRIANQEGELKSLEREKEKAEHNLQAMEATASRQLEEAHHLMHRINQLSKRESEARVEVDHLRNELQRARLNGEMTFSELKLEVEAIARERGEYREKYLESAAEIARLQQALEEAQQRERAAIAFARELGATPPPVRESKGITFRVSVFTSMQRVRSREIFKGYDPVFEFREDGKFNYALGAFDNLTQAEKFQEELEQKGFGMARIVAFRKGKHISLNEALETALE